MEIVQFQNPKIQENLIYIHPDEVPNLSDRKRRYYAWIAECQKYYQRNPIKFIEDAFNLHLIDAQKLVIQMAWTTPNVLLNCTRGFGKALWLQTPILTPHGFKLLKDIHPGDYVYSEKGKPIKVLAESEIWHNDTYDLFFDDDIITANEDHIWKVWDGNSYIESDTKSLEASFRQGMAIDMPEPVEFEPREVPLDPYVLGLWLTSKGEENLVEVMKKDAQEIINKLESKNYKVLVRTSPSKRRVYLSIYNPDGSSFIQTLKKAGAYESKSIPDEYLQNSVEVRFALLDGMIDGMNMPSLDGESLEFRFEQEEFLLSRLKKVLNLFTLLGIKHEARLDEYATVFKFYPDPARINPIQRIADSLPDSINPDHKRKEILYLCRSRTVPTKCIQVDNPSGLFLCGYSCKVTHNSTLISILLMAKGMLFNNYWTYICSGTANQAQTTFTTLERLANDNIDSFQGSTGYIFKNELVTNSTTGMGFTHSTKGYQYKLSNGSETRTLSSNIDAERGQRGNTVFDESGFLSSEMINVFKAFAVVDKSFITGGGSEGGAMSELERMTLPKEIPYQLFFISSASTTDSEFFRLYRQFAIRMFMGDTDYFVAELDYTVTQNPLIHGKPSRRSLLSKQQVDDMLKTSPEKAEREYFCQFTTDAGDDAIIRRSTIIRNSEIRPPLMYNDTGKKKFIIAYDPARISDNSVVGIGEIYKDGEDYKLRIVNCINMIDRQADKKRPPTQQEQLRTLRDIILDYNDGGSATYDNIEGIYIDAGNGGQGPAIYDNIVENWETDTGKHLGFLDLEYNTQVYNDDAVTDKLHMVEPAKYKPIIFEALIEMVRMDAIKFTDNYDNSGELVVYDDLNDESVAKRIPLTLDESAALVNIDYMKDQLVNMVRLKSDSSRGDRFEIAREKRRAYPNDDHAYVCALLAYGLKCYRDKFKRQDTRSNSQELINLLGSRMRKPKGLS